MRPKALLALCVFVAVSAAPHFAVAQTDKPDKTFDLKPFVPPVLPPLPPNSYLTPGTVGPVTPSPYTSPLYGSDPAPLPAPGIRLTIPTR